MARCKRSFTAGLFLLGTIFSSHLAAVDSANSPASHPIQWGVCGHPTWPDYADWIPGNMTKEIGLVRELGCTYYRCSFEGASYPAILDTVVPPAESAGVTILPILPIRIQAKNSADANYQTNYELAQAWANQAIGKGYNLPYWELGNEVENGSLVSVVGDGALPAQFPDKTPGGFVALAASLKGAYQGLKDAYASGRAKQTTQVVPKILFGCTYRHWGLLAKIRDYNKAMPCDIISWHWYYPAYGSFLDPIHGISADFGRTPAECLADFKTPDGQPMDVWITETNRSEKPDAKTYLNGSFSNNASGQDWPAQAQALQKTITDLTQATNVKTIIVYELLDEPVGNKSSAYRLRTEGWMGLMTKLGGTRKDAFTTYQQLIKSHP